MQRRESGVNKWERQTMREKGEGTKQRKTDGQSKDEVEDMELAIVGIGSIRSPLHTTYD